MCIDLIIVGRERNSANIVIHLDREHVVLVAHIQEMNVSKASVESQKVRGDLKLLHLSLLQQLPADLELVRPSRVHVVAEEVVEVSGAHDELLAVAGEVSRVDRKVLKVDSLHFGI